MHILYLTPFNPSEFSDYLLVEKDSLPQIHESASAVHALIRSILEQGHTVTVITYNMQKKPVIDSEYKGTRLTVRVLKQTTVVPKGMAFVRFYMAIRMKKAVLQYIDEVDVIHAHWTYDFALAASFFTGKKPVFCTVRDWAPYIFSLKRDVYWLVSLAVAKVVYWNKKVNFIANSYYTYNCIHKAYPSKVVPILPNPIDNRFIIKKREKYPTDIVFVSISQSNDTRKNYDVLLQAFKEFRERNNRGTLMLIGGCFVRDNLKCKEWEKKGLLGNVQLCGKVQHEALIDYLDKASVLIHPSLEETFGNILLEGMARRLPVIGGKSSGAVPYVLGHGKYGFLCDVSDVKDVVRVMELMFDKDIFFSKLDAATKVLCSQYSYNLIGERHIELYISKMSSLSHSV